MEMLIKGGGPLKGEIRVPADKSISHRTVMLGALAQGRSRVRNFLRAEDTLATVRCLQALGAAVEEPVPGEDLVIEGQGLKGIREANGVLDCGNSGTTMRLLTGLAAGYPFMTILTGDDSLRQRPMARVVRPLLLMGAALDGRKNGAYAPLTVRGGRLRGIEYPLPVASAQVKSSILLAGLNIEGETKLIEPAASRDHTERMLQAMGADLRREGAVIQLTGGKELQPQEFTVPGDISSAAFFLVGASLVPGSELLLRDVGINPSRTGAITVLQQMGASIQVENERLISGEPIADLVVKSAPLKGIEIEAELIPSLIDELPVLALAMALAEGESSVAGAEELRVKETDRIHTICANLTALGVKAEETPDGFRVQGAETLRGGELSSFGDHRLAMTMGIAGLISQGEIRLKGAEAVGVSYPHFWEDLDRLIR